MDSIDSFLVGGVRILRLSGSDGERARRHGEEVAKLGEAERRTLAIQPLASKNQRMLDQAIRNLPAIPGPVKAMISKAVVSAYQALVHAHHRRLPKALAHRLESFALYSSISKDDLIFALYQPDFLMMLAGVTREKMRQHFLGALPGCSTATVRTGSEGGVMVLRNLDYSAAGHWEKWPTVFFHEPSDPDRQKHIAVGSLGIHLPGLTGVNESGIVFTLHAHFSKTFSMRGTPIFFLGQEILERARSIDDGIAICRNFRTIGAWAVNLISERENRAVTVELVGGKVHVRESCLDGPVHAHTNGHQAKEFKECELHVSGSFAEDVRARKGFLERTLAPEKGRFPSVEEALATLASHQDSLAGEDRVFGNAVSVVTTIQSTAFDLSRGEILVSSRTESPTGFGPYLSVPSDWSKVAGAMQLPRWIRPSVGLSSDFMEAVHQYHRAYCSWHMMWESAERAREYLILATALAGRDPHLLMQRGYFELMLSRGPADHRTALDCFDRALAEKLSVHHGALARYFRGVCLDLMGEREEARREYARVAAGEGLDQRLEKRARLRLRQPFTASDCRGILPDLHFVEPVEYA